MSMDHRTPGGRSPATPCEKVKALHQVILQRGMADGRRVLTPDERLGVLPLEPVATSGPLGWPGLRVEHYRGEVDVDLDLPGLTHHLLVCYLRPTGLVPFQSEGPPRQGPPPGSLLMLPAGTPARPTFRGPVDAVHVLLAPRLLSRVAAEAFDLSPDQVTLPAASDLSHPQIGAAILALDAELTGGGAGGRLLAESLANVLAVQLLRQFVAPGPAGPRQREVLPRGKLQAVTDYIEAHLDAELTLDDLAAVARLSPYHFARLFKNSTGLPPHQYVISRRVERAKELLRDEGGLPLADVATEVGFANQSHFTRHFKRLVGVTPKRFR
jgi:AraC family transcriptional regulator